MEQFFNSALKELFAATCPIRNKKTSGASEDLVLEPGKEQYCPSGQIVVYADGTAIKDLKCSGISFIFFYCISEAKSGFDQLRNSGAGLEIEKEDGTKVQYSRANQPTLQCGPG